MRNSLLAILPSHRWLLFGVLVLSLALPHPVLRIPAAFFFVGIAPGLPFVCRTGAGGIAALGMTLVVSPVIVGAVTLLLLLARVPVYLAPSFAIGLCAAVYMLTGGVLPSRDRDTRRLAMIAIGIIAIVAIVVFALPLTQLWWRVRWDSWYHAAVFNRLWMQGLPLQDPLFSPLRLQYMYFYHVILLCVARLTQLNAFYSMIFVNGVALAGLSFSFLWLTGFFTRRLAARVTALLVCLLGMNGFFYLFYPLRLARAFFGETAGSDLVRHFFQVSPPGHVTAARLLSIEGNQFLMLEKFMLGNAVTLSLGLMCAALGLLLRLTKEGWTRWHTTLYGAAILGLMLLHVIIGSFTVAAIAAALVIAWASSRDSRYAHALLVTAVPAVLSVPYIYSVFPRDTTGSLAFSVQPLRTLGLLSSILPALLLALPSMRNVPRLLLAWLGVIAVAALTIDLTTTSESKFAFLLFVPLAAIASGTIDRWLDGARTRRLAIAYVVLATVPVNVAYFAVASRDPSTFEVSDDEEIVYDWVRNRSPADAVFLEDRDIIRIPVLGARDQYYGTSYYAHLWRYPVEEMERRRAIRDRMFGRSPLADADLKRLRSLGRPFFVVCRLDDEGGVAAADKLRASDAFREVLATDTIVLFLLDASRAGPEGKAI